MNHNCISLCFRVLIASVWIQSFCLHSNSLSGQSWTDFSGVDSGYGVVLSWKSGNASQVDSIIVERGRDNSTFETIAVLAHTENRYEDFSAFFGEYHYRLRSSTEKNDHVSESVLVESYGGSTCRTLYPKEGIAAGTVFNLVYGNAQKNDSIWVGLYRRNAVLLGDFVTVSLNNQLLKVKTDSLKSGNYILVTKLRESPISFYRFKIN